MNEEIIYGKVGVYIMSSKTSNNSKYTEDWVPVKNITNGMIELDNKQKVTGVKIRPRNIFILDPITQSNIIALLKTFYTIHPDFGISIFCFTDKTVNNQPAPIFFLW